MGKGKLRSGANLRTSLLQRAVLFYAPLSCVACEAEGELICHSCRLDLVSSSSSCFYCGIPTQSFAICAKHKSALDRVIWVGGYSGALEGAIKLVKFDGLKGE